MLLPMSKTAWAQIFKKHDHLVKKEKNLFLFGSGAWFAFSSFLGFFVRQSVLLKTENLFAVFSQQYLIYLLIIKDSIDLCAGHYLFRLSLYLGIATTALVSKN